MSLTPRLDRLEINRVINGNLDFWQRGTNFAAIADNTYFADRFSYGKSGTMVHTASRSTDVPDVQSTYSALIDCTTADASIAAGDFTVIKHKIEGYDLQPFAGKDFVLSFKVKATKTGTYCVSLQNAGSNRSYVAEYTVEVADTWEIKKIPVTHNVAGTWDYINGIGLNVQWALAAGSTFQTTAGTWQTGDFLATSNQVNACDDVANNFQISQVMVSEGTQAGEFRRAGRNIQEELALCQRYYEKSYNVDVAPGSITLIGSVLSVAANGVSGEFIVANFRVRKRAIPSALFWNRVTGASGSIRNETTIADFATTATHISESNFYTTNSPIDTNLYAAHWTAEAEL